MQESPSLEEKSSGTCLETKHDKLEEKAGLLVKKISEIANENLELKDRLYRQKELYLKQEKQIRFLTKEKTKLGIELKSSNSAISERANTVKSLSHEIHTIKTLVRYLLSHEMTKFYYGSYHIFMLPKVLLFENMRGPSWKTIKDPIKQALKGLKTLLLSPLNIRQIYYYRKLKRENPLSENFKENFDPNKVNLKMKKDLRKSWMLKQLVEKEKFLTKNFPPYLPEKLEGSQKKQIKIACILDEFSFSCFSYEASMTQLGFENWEEQINTNNFELLLVESAWKGKDLLWKDEIGGKNHKEGSNLARLIQTCKDKGIPTVFWNKEDPPHFKHFLEASKLFDHVFTSCENKISDYQKELGHNHIESLSFACQPVIHNPIGSKVPKKGKVAFAGSWHENRHEKRKVDMFNLLRPSLSYKLHIFDRMADHLLDNYIFPFEYQSCIQGYLPYQRMLTAYRGYKAFLNVNSVQDSNTMFSRRVYELMACGTNVVSGPTKGFEFNFGPGLIYESKNEDETNKQLERIFENEEESERISHKAMREALSKHTYAQRLDQILLKTGLNKHLIKEKTDTVIFLDLKNRNFLKKSLENFERQNLENKSLYIFCKRKQDLEPIEKQLEQYENPNIYLFGGEEGSTFYDDTLSIISSLRSEYISFFDENCYYGSHFISDLQISFLYTNTSVASKKNYYLLDEKSNKLFQKEKGHEHFLSSNFNEKCFIAKRNLFKDPLFKEELLFNKNNLEESLKNLDYDVYQADRFNFLESKQENTENLDLVQSFKNREEAEEFTSF